MSEFKECKQSDWKCCNCNKVKPLTIIIIPRNNTVRDTRFSICRDCLIKLNGEIGDYLEHEEADTE